MYRYFKTATAAVVSTLIVVVIVIVNAYFAYVFISCLRFGFLAPYFIAR